MEAHTELSCEQCGQIAPTAVNVQVDSLGRQLQWPKASVKSDGIYFTITCPQCGERQQRIRKRPDESELTFSTIGLPKVGLRETSD